MVPIFKRMATEFSTEMIYVILLGGRIIVGKKICNLRKELKYFRRTKYKF
jgi:hypothetical protein